MRLSFLALLFAAWAAAQSFDAIACLPPGSTGASRCTVTASSVYQVPFAPEGWQSLRYAPRMEFMISGLATGAYLVELTFLDPKFGPGRRTMAVTVNDQLVYSRLDVSRAAGGPFKLLRRAAIIPVVDGQAVVTLEALTGTNAVLSRLAVWPLPWPSTPVVHGPAERIDARRFRAPGAGFDSQLMVFYNGLFQSPLIDYTYRNGVIEFLQDVGEGAGVFYLFER